MEGGTEAALVVGFATGAAGAAGVDATGGGAGVEGPPAFTAGAVLGYVKSVLLFLKPGVMLTLDTIHTINPFSSIL